jgi:N6-adenosine-specific RNA methylase IME4
MDNQTRWPLVSRFGERRVCEWNIPVQGRGYPDTPGYKDGTSAARGAPVRGHSEKPKEFYDLVERLCPAPRYADLFSRRRHSDKWDCHGDEAPPMREAAE